MGVFCFASLKGGVGKTSLAINVSHAFAKRGCRTLLIDCDPACHSTQYFPESRKTTSYSPLARLLLSKAGSDANLDQDFADDQDLDSSQEEPFIARVRDDFDLLLSGKELAHLLWGKGAKTFRMFFPTLLAELKDVYDHIVIDTPPDYNVLTRTALGVADVVAVPIDPSEMSINSLEELVSSARHIEGPTWSIVRTMINRQASRIQRLSSERVGMNLNIQAADYDEDEVPEEFLGSTEEFIEMLHQREAEFEGSNSTGRSDPIFLLDGVVSRTEQQNRLSYLGKTSFDLRATRTLAEQYLSIARELDDLLAVESEAEVQDSVGEFCVERASDNDSEAEYMRFAG